MLKSISQKMVAITICFSIIFTLLRIPAAAITYPAYGVISHNDGAGVYSQPGYILNGHDGRLDKDKPSNRLTTLATNAKVKLFATAADGDGDMWYEIGYGDNYQNKGYVICGRVKVIANYVYDQEFEDWLTNQGFPDSYKSGLRDMHALYPNWKFYADHTNLDFNAAVKAENGGVNNKYVHVNSDSSLKSYEKGAYNWNTGKWTGYDGDSWIKTTDQVVAYYVDPRNFLDITNVFMFANESFNAEKEDLDFVKNAVKGTFMDAVLPEYASKAETEQKTYAEAILEAAQQSGVSTATIVALIRQEQGNDGNGKLISGNYIYKEFDKNGVLIKEVKDFIGYYNFFNIGAYADIKNGFPEAAYRGLWWAKGAGNGATTYKRPWNTREKAIIGGAVWYGGNYVSVGQNTIYYKNFNVYQNTKYDVYTHQYATNIEDSKGKGSMMAQGMSGIVDGEMIFHIPVYKNMPEKTTLPTKGTNNNRFLKSLSVEGYTLSATFDRYTYTYEAVVPYTASKVKINAISEATDAKITGAGEVELATGNNDIKVVVTSSSGAIATYNLTIYREKAPAGEAEMPVVNTNYKIDRDNVISGITDKTSISDFKTKLSVTKGRAVIMDSLGNEKKDGLVATGDKVHLYDANDKIRASYTALIYGDVSGDGKISSKDVYYLRRLILEKEKLPAIKVKAADVNKDSKVSSKDVYYTRRHILEREIITQ